MAKTTTYYIVKRGAEFLRFTQGYSIATPSSSPHPRGCYTRRKDAESRASRPCFIREDRIAGKELEVAAVTITWDK